MRRKIAHIFLWLPLLLVLLHSFVPHHHTTDALGINLSQGHECHESLLSGLFEFDLGAHHLEEYQTSQQDFEFSAATQFVLLFSSVYNLSEQDAAHQTWSVFESVDVKHQNQDAYKPLRAPPALLS